MGETGQEGARILGTMDAEVSRRWKLLAASARRIARVTSDPNRAVLLDLIRDYEYLCREDDAREAAATADLKKRVA